MSGNWDIPADRTEYRLSGATDTRESMPTVVDAPHRVADREQRDVVTREADARGNGAGRGHVAGIGVEVLADA